MKPTRKLKLIKRAKRADAIKTAIDSLQALALEFQVIPTPKMIDERLVYWILDDVFDCGCDADLFFDGYKSVTEFLEHDENPVQKLFELWREMKVIGNDDDYDLSKYDCEVTS